MNTIPADQSVPLVRHVDDSELASIQGGFYDQLLQAITELIKSINTAAEMTRNLRG